MICKEAYIKESVDILLSNHNSGVMTVQEAVTISEFLWYLKQREQTSE